MTTIDVSYLFLFYFILNPNDVNVIKNIGRLFILKNIIGKSFILKKCYIEIEIEYIEC